MRERREETYSETAEEELTSAAAREWRNERRAGCEDSERRNGGSWEEMGLSW